jgi:DNA-directed RNA polymerase II subunit RPB11
LVLLRPIVLTPPLRSQLLTDPAVLFAGYQVPHPLENDITLKIQTDSTSNPTAALKKACTHLIAQTVNLKKQFEDQCRNIQLGMGPEHAQATGTAGAYDPYGADGIGHGRQDDVGAYDF